MKILTAPIFILCCIAFVIHQVLQKILHINIRFFNDYLDNLLVTPILLTFLVVERRMLFRRGASYVLSPLEVIIATVFIALICELLFPYLSPEFKTDWLDVIFYALGSILFYHAINFYPSGQRNDADDLSKH